MTTTTLAAPPKIRVGDLKVALSTHKGGEGGTSSFVSAEARDLATNVPLNGAYRYTDWLLTVPLLLIEILLVINIDEHVFSTKSWTLGVDSVFMICFAYYGELVTRKLIPRWMCLSLSIIVFLYIRIRSQSISWACMALTWFLLLTSTCLYLILQVHYACKFLA